MPHQADLVSLADVVRVELERLGAIPRRRKSDPGLLKALNEAGRSLDLEGGLLAWVDGERAAIIVATLERVVIVEYASGAREAIRLDRIYVIADAVRFCDTCPTTSWGHQSVSQRASARGQPHAAAAKRERLKAAV